MDEQKIHEQYKKFNIPEQKIPNYDNPNKFAMNFKKCSVLRESSVFYTSSTSNQEEK